MWRRVALAKSEERPKDLWCNMGNLLGLYTRGNCLIIIWVVVYTISDVKILADKLMA